jgi:phage terminase large subunit GpA-like protein
MLVVLPTVEMGKRWSKGRFAPLIDDTPAIRAKVKDPRSRDAGNTVQSKEFPGGIVVITGANSAVGLREYHFLCANAHGAGALSVHARVRCTQNKN